MRNRIEIRHSLMSNGERRCCPSSFPVRGRLYHYTRIQFSRPRAIVTQRQKSGPGNHVPEVFASAGRSLRLQQTLCVCTTLFASAGHSSRAQDGILEKCNSSTPTCETEDRDRSQTQTRPARTKCAAGGTEEDAAKMALFIAVVVDAAKRKFRID